jgi:hypothetical protein
LGRDWIRPVDFEDLIPAMSGGCADSATCLSDVSGPAEPSQGDADRYCPPAFVEQSSPNVGHGDLAMLLAEKVDAVDETAEGRTSDHNRLVRPEPLRRQKGQVNSHLLRHGLFPFGYSIR